MEKIPSKTALSENIPLVKLLRQVMKNISIIALLALLGCAVHREEFGTVSGEYVRAELSYNEGRAIVDLKDNSSVIIRAGETQPVFLISNIDGELSLLRLGEDVDDERLTYEGKSLRRLLLEKGDVSYWDVDGDGVVDIKKEKTAGGGERMWKREPFNWIENDPNMLESTSALPAAGTPETHP